METDLELINRSLIDSETKLAALKKQNDQVMEQRRILAGLLISGAQRVDTGLWAIYLKDDAFQILTNISEGKE